MVWGRDNGGMRIRTASPADLDALAALETACFPPAEAADRDALAARLASCPDHFWLALDDAGTDGAADGPDDGALLACVDGMCTDTPDLTDEMFSRADLHDPRGAWQMIFGVMTAPERRGEGLAGTLLEHVVESARADRRRGLVLTAKPELVGFYARFGFDDEGVSPQSTHGGAVWHQMRLTL